MDVSRGHFQNMMFVHALLEILLPPSLNCDATVLNAIVAVKSSRVALKQQCMHTAPLPRGCLTISNVHTYMES